MAERPRPMTRLSELQQDLKSQPHFGKTLYGGPVGFLTYILLGRLVLFHLS